MLTTATVSIIFILICFLFFYSKQDMLKKLFTNQLSYPASELQKQLELTADIVIKNLESHIIHLEDLLVQADERIKLLDSKIQQATPMLPDRLNIADQGEPLTCQDQHPAPGLPYGVTQYRQNNGSGSAAADEASVHPLKPADIKGSDGKNEETESASQPISQQRHVIIAMFKQGYTETEIAKATGFGKGEILLFLQLHKND